MRFNLQFAEGASSGGISSLGINLKSFIFQLITFVIVLLILRRWVFPKLVATLEARRKTLEESLAHAKQIEETLVSAEANASHLLHQAREQADEALRDAKSQARELVAKSEESAREQAERILEETKAQIIQEHNKLREELKTELTALVAEASEKVLRAKLTTKEDQKLIEQSIKELS